jgi:hypothetical protein
MASRLLNAAGDEPDLDDNSRLVLDYALREILSRRGPDAVDKATLRRSVLSLAAAIGRVDGVPVDGAIAPERVLEALQYLADARTLYGFLRAESLRGQPVSGPGSPIHGRLEAVFGEWGRSVPEATDESLQELAESVGFKFDGPAIGPAAQPPGNSA